MNTLNKYNATKTYSNLCKREFDSKLEARHAEDLWLLQLSGEISSLEFQIPLILSTKPNVKAIIDFRYIENGKEIYADAKGILTDAARIKYAWVKNKYGIDIKLLRR